MKISFVQISTNRKFWPSCRFSHATALCLQYTSHLELCHPKVCIETVSSLTAGVSIWSNKHVGISGFDTAVHLYNTNVTRCIWYFPALFRFRNETFSKIKEGRLCIMFILMNILMLNWLNIAIVLSSSYAGYHCNQYSYYEVYYEYSSIT